MPLAHELDELVDREAHPAVLREALRVDELHKSDVDVLVVASRQSPPVGRPDHPGLLHHVPVPGAKLVLELHNPSAGVPVADPEIRVLLEVSLRRDYAPGLLLANAQSPRRPPQILSGIPFWIF